MDLFGESRLALEDGSDACLHWMAPGHYVGGNIIISCFSRATWHITFGMDGLMGLRSQWKGS